MLRTALFRAVTGTERTLDHQKETSTQPVWTGVLAYPSEGSRTAIECFVIVIVGWAEEEKS